MKYFKNTELAKLYNVSEKSVRNWIQAAQEEKLELQLYEERGKNWVANTSKNTALIEELVQRGKKYKNTRSYKIVKPTEKFYKTYSNKQILDIASNLTIRHEVPLQYSYADGGASYWDKYANKLINEKTANNITKAIELLDTAYKDLERFIGNRRINVIDLGPGNALPVRDFLAKLLSENRLNRYIAIDNSREMLEIAKHNLNTWFSDSIKFESYVRDISQERFDDIFAADYANDNDDLPVNIILLIGGTLSNFRTPSRSIQAINDSMGLDDILIYTEKLDTPNTRRYFDFNIAAENQKLTPRHKLILDMLSIDDSYYDVEQLYDPEKRGRFIRIRPTVDIAIQLEVANGPRHIELQKHVPITLWRAWHWTLNDVASQFTAHDFELLQVNRAKETEYCLLAMRIKVDDF